MSAEAVALVLLSALLHPLRDLLFKRHPNPESAYLGVMLGWVPIAGTHALLTGHSLMLDPVPLALAALSAICLIAYYFGTMAALKSGDLSIYYPIIRSSPLLVVAFTWAVGWRDYRLIVLVGIALVVFASFALQRQQSGTLSNPRTAALAVLAMAGSAFSIICDQLAMAPGTTPGSTFLMWTHLLVTPGYALTAIYTRPSSVPLREHLFSAWGHSPGRILTASLVSYGSYIVIMVAFAIGAGAAETAAVRQASIPISVVLAAIVLGETRFLHRLGWASLIAIGIVLIAMG